jgi:branched-chain amino acid transport system substrate-binding protein
MHVLARWFTALIAVLLAGVAQAQGEIKLGAVLSLTGPAASLGIPARNTLELLPRTIAGQPVRFVILDDASDPAAAVRAARRLIDEERVDAIIGPSVTPTSLALLEVIAPARTPMISLAGSAVIAAPVEGPKAWAFKLAPEEPTMGAYIFRNMALANQRTLGFIGFNDAFGESFIGAMKKIAQEQNVRVVADERYNRTDTSVTAQALKIVSTAPDAVIVGASGTPGVTPVLELRRLGYRGAIYINQGMANPDVLRVGGRDLDGVMMPVSPVLVAEQLPDTNPVKAPALRYAQAYEARHGAASRNLFGATAWDAFFILEGAVPKARAVAQPGTPEFRTALRDAMRETRDLVGAQGVFTMSPTNHNGTDMRAQALVRIENGGWKYVPLSF